MNTMTNKRFPEKNLHVVRTKPRWKYFDLTPLKMWVIGLIVWEMGCFRCVTTHLRFISGTPERSYPLECEVKNLWEAQTNPWWKSVGNYSHHPVVVMLIKVIQKQSRWAIMWLSYLSRGKKAKYSQPEVLRQFAAALLLNMTTHYDIIIIFHWWLGSEEFRLLLGKVFKFHC